MIDDLDLAEAAEMEALVTRWLCHYLQVQDSLSAVGEEWNQILAMAREL